MDSQSCLKLASATSCSGSSGGSRGGARVAALHRRLFLEAVAGIAETSFCVPLDPDRRHRWILCLEEVDVLHLIHYQDFANSLLALASCIKDLTSDRPLIHILSKDIVLEVLHSTIQKLRAQEDTPPDSSWWIAVRNLARHSPYPAFFQLPGGRGAHVQLLDDIVFLINLEISTILGANSDVWRSHMRSVSTLRLPLLCMLDVLEACSDVSVGNEEYFKVSSSSADIAHSLVKLSLKLEALVTDDRRFFGTRKSEPRHGDESDRSDDNGGGGDDDGEGVSSDEHVAAEAYMPFAETCLSKACSLVRRILRLRPALVFSAAPSDCFEWIKSQCWQVQLLCVTIIRTRLAVESSSDAVASRSGKVGTEKKAAENEKGSQLAIGVGVKGSSGKVKAAESSKQRSGSRLPGRAQGVGRTKTFDEICRSGFLRPLLWCLLHMRRAIRETALEMLEELTRGAVTLPDGGADLWAGLVEQGLVALLEIVHCGLAVIPNPNPGNDSAVGSDASEALSFPEHRVSLRAREVLELIALQLGSDQTLRSRAVSALVHTGSPRLRANIFSGIAFLSARSPQLGLLLWSGSVQGALERAAGGRGGDIFQKLVDSVYKDPSEMSSIVSFMHHVLHISLRRQGALIASSAAGVSVLEPSPADRSSYLQGGPTVAVRCDGTLVKMMCAAPAAVAAHSQSFAHFLQVTMDEQRERIRRALLGGEDGGGTLDTDIIRRAIATSPHSDFVELLGCSYDVWQEVFSHIVDAFLLEQSIAKMDVQAVVEAYSVARKFQMRRLGDRYASELGKRLVVDNFADILEVSRLDTFEATVVHWSDNIVIMMIIMILLMIIMLCRRRSGYAAGWLPHPLFPALRISLLMRAQQRRTSAYATTAWLTSRGTWRR